MMDEVETEDESQQESVVDSSNIDEDATTKQDVDTKDIERQQRIEEAAESFYQAMKRMREDEQAASIVPEVIDDPEPIEEVVEVVLYRDRMHWIQLVGTLSQLLIVVLTCGILFIMFFVLQDMAKSLLPDAKFIAMLFPMTPLALTGILLVMVFVKNGKQIINELIRWLHTRLVVTNLRVIYSVNVRGWGWNLFGGIEDVEESLVRSSVINPQIKQTWLGEILGYVTVTFESPAERDITFRNMRYIRRPNQIKAIFNL
jgi:hypothetical protein